MKMRLPEVIVCLSVLASCSVKEDRSVCPCRLMLDFADVDTSVVQGTDIRIYSDDGFVFTDSVHAAVFDREYVVDVPRGELHVNAWSGCEDMSDDNGGIVIPYGCGCPPVYMHSVSVSAYGEICREKVLMRKNHCRLTVMVQGKDTSPYSFTVRGNVCGYTREGQPERGAFSSVAYPDAEGKVSVVLPRQVDSSLLLDLDDGGSISRTFALGEYIRASGYDWSAPDLEDLHIVIDYFATNLLINVRWWDKEYEFDIVL